MSEKVRHYQEAMAEFDFDALAKLRHPDFVCEYPQSGERIIGHANWVAAHTDYASRFLGSDSDVLDARVKGDHRRTQVTTSQSPVLFATSPIVNVSGGGDLVTLEGRGTWPDGRVYCWVWILEYRDGLVWKQTDYYADPFEPPSWRAPFVEVMET